MKTLVNTIAIKISSSQKERLAAIDAVDLAPIIKRANLDLLDSGKRIVLPVDEAAYALRQYYSLAAINPRNQHAVSAVVDPYWHTHVLHTLSYADFCQQAIGYFMHHDPLDKEDLIKVEDVGELYGYTLDILNVLYSGNVNPIAWGSEIMENRVCLHYHTCDPAAESLYPADPRPRFVEIRSRYSAVASA